MKRSTWENSGTVVHDGKGTVIAVATSQQRAQLIAREHNHAAGFAAAVECLLDSGATVADIERAMVEAAVRRSSTIRCAAKLIGVSERTMYRRNQT